MDKAAISWLVFAVVCGILEIATPAFGFILVSGAAVAAAIVCAAGFGLAAQIGTFAVAAALSLTLLRSYLLRRMGQSPGVPSRTDKLVGRVGRVTEAIDPVRVGGRIVVDGSDWAAQAAEPIAAGTEVRIEGVDGIRLNVRRL